MNGLAAAVVGLEHGRIVCAAQKKKKGTLTSCSWIVVSTLFRNTSSS